MHYVAVIYIGKTNAKLAIVDVQVRREVDVVTMPNTVLETGPYPHFDIDKIWGFLLNSLATFAQQYSFKRINITTHGACVVLMDQNGQLATPVLDYEHDGPDQSRQLYSSIRPPFKLTGSPRLPGGLNAGAQLHWLLTRDPQLLERVKTIVMYPQYWAYRLCGVAANEPTSLGCHTDLWIPTEGTCSTLVDQLEIRDKIAEVKLPSTKLGYILPALADKTGLASDTAIYCGIHDSNASLFTHLHDIDPPFSVVSTGTWVVCMSPGGNTTALDETKDTLINVSATGAPVPSSRFMGGREYDYLVQTYSATPTDHILDGTLQSCACILPAVEPGCGPYQQLQYRWTVEPGKLSAEERYNAICFYLAMMTDTCLRQSGAAGDIIVEGPFAANQPYCALLAAASGRPVFGKDSSTTGTSLGAALLTLDAPDSSGGNAGRAQTPCEATPALRAYASQWRTHTAQHAASSA